MQRLWIGLGGLLGAVAVTLAAAAAHGSGFWGVNGVEQVRAAAQIAGWHALAILAVALWAPRAGPVADLAGLMFFVGAVLFVGAVMGPLLGLPPTVVRAAPFGGTLLIAAWLVLAASSVFRRGA